MPAAVVFDLDGVLVDSESAWDRARREVVDEFGGRWNESATTYMLGMSAPEWSRYLVEQLGVRLRPEEVNAAVVKRMLELYRRALPLVPGAVPAVRRLSPCWPLGLATSSNREVVQAFLELSGLAKDFTAWVSSEEVSRGKPAPDVYLETARRLGVPPQRCVAIEDSANGLRAAEAATMAVVAIPNREFPPDALALALAAAVLPSVAELTPDVVKRAAAAGR